MGIVFSFVPSVFQRNFMAANALWADVVEKQGNADLGNILSKVCINYEKCKRQQGSLAYWISPPHVYNYGYASKCQRRAKQVYKMALQDFEALDKNYLRPIPMVRKRTPDIYNMLEELMEKLMKELEGSNPSQKYEELVNAVRRLLQSVGNVKDVMKDTEKANKIVECLGHNFTFMDLYCANTDDETVNDLKKKTSEVRKEAISLKLKAGEELRSTSCSQKCLSCCYPGSAVNEKERPLVSAIDICLQKVLDNLNLIEARRYSYPESSVGKKAESEVKDTEANRFHPTARVVYVNHPYDYSTAC